MVGDSADGMDHPDNRVSDAYKAMMANPGDPELAVQWLSVIHRALILLEFVDRSELEVCTLWGKHNATPGAIHSEEPRVQERSTNSSRIRDLCITENLRSRVGSKTLQ